MTTLGDVKKYVSDQVVYMKFFGTTGKFNKGFNNFCRALGSVIAKEKGIGKEEAMNLPEDTELGYAARKKFLRFQLWVEEER